MIRSDYGKLMSLIVGSDYPFHECPIAMHRDRFQLFAVDRAAKDWFTNNTQGLMNPIQLPTFRPVIEATFVSSSPNSITPVMVVMPKDIRCFMAAQQSIGANYSIRQLEFYQVIEVFNTTYRSIEVYLSSVAEK